MSFIMSHDILEKIPSAQQKLRKGLFSASLLQRCMKSFSAAEINQYSSIMVNESEAIYKFMVNEGKAAGVPILTKMPIASNSTESKT